MTDAVGAKHRCSITCDVSPLPPLNRQEHAVVKKPGHAALAPPITLLQQGWQRVAGGGDQVHKQSRVGEGKNAAKLDAAK